MSYDLQTVDIKPISEREEEWANEIRHRVEQMPQYNFPTYCHLFAGIYSRTVIMPPNAILVGAKIKVDTFVIVSGHCVVNINEKLMELKGYHLLKASAGRRQVFRSFDETYITMQFSTESKDLAECEKIFTDEWEQLLTNKLR